MTVYGCVDARDDAPVAVREFVDAVVVVDDAVGRWISLLFRGKQLGSLEGRDAADEGLEQC
jgi:hypothetical protein